MPDTKPEELLAYLREHGSKHDFDTLRQRLAALKGTPDAIERAIVLYQGERLSAWPTMRPSAGSILGGFGALTLGVLSLLTFGVGFVANSEPGPTSEGRIFSIVAYCIALALGAAAVAVQYRLFRNPK